MINLVFFLPMTSFQLPCLASSTVSRIRLIVLNRGMLWLTESYLSPQLLTENVLGGPGKFVVD
jgi:hypothetical protein